MSCSGVVRCAEWRGSSGVGVAAAAVLPSWSAATLDDRYTSAAARCAGPCRRFTPLLGVCYEDSKDVEVRAAVAPRASPSVMVCDSPDAPKRPLVRVSPPPALWWWWWWWLQIVFVSSDDDIDGFNEYYGEMGWAAVPFGDADRRSALSERFGVSGIPALIILDAATGALVTTEGRAKVADKKALDGVFTA